VHQLGDGQGDWTGAVPEHFDLWPYHCIHCTAVHNVLFDLRYTNWETDKVIGRELYQNILTSGLAIFFTVLLFLGRLEEQDVFYFLITTVNLPELGTSATSSGISLFAT
jgi:hypothetical protein